MKLLAAPLSLLPPDSLSAMASALSYVSKFKSFVILFVTPILLLPLIILMPAKVSCVSGQPLGFWAPGAQQQAPNPGALGGAHGFPGAGTAPLRHGGSGAPGAMGGALQGILTGMDLGVHRSQGARTVLVSTETQKLAPILATQPLYRLRISPECITRSPGPPNATCTKREPGGLSFPSFSCLFPWGMGTSQL